MWQNSLEESQQYDVVESHYFVLLMRSLKPTPGRNPCVNLGALDTLQSPLFDEVKGRFPGLVVRCSTRCCESHRLTASPHRCTCVCCRCVQTALCRRLLGVVCARGVHSGVRVRQQHRQSGDAAAGEAVLCPRETASAAAAAVATPNCTCTGVERHAVPCFTW
jgi:hypothetical protein